MKKPNSKMLAGYIILGAVLLGMLFLMFAGKGSKEGDTKNYEVNLTENEKSVYESKLAAYEAANKNPVVVPVVYEDEEPELEDTVQTVEIQQEKAAGRNALAAATQQAQRLTANMKNAGVAASDDEYNALEKDIKTYYQGGRSDPKQPVESDKARRKRQLEEGWNLVKEAPGSTGQNYKGVVHGTQSIRSGGTATFRTSQDIMFDGKTIPKGTLVSGMVTISQNRVFVSIGTVRIGRDIVPLQLNVYGSDGMKGIPIVVDNTARTANKEIGNETIDQIGETTRKVGGSIGRTISNIVTGVAKSVKRDREQEILLIDNQMIILRFN